MQPNGANTRGEPLAYKNPKRKRKEWPPKIIVTSMITLTRRLSQDTCTPFARDPEAGATDQPNANLYRVEPIRYDPRYGSSTWYTSLCTNIRVSQCYKVHVTNPFGFSVTDGKLLSPYRRSADYCCCVRRRRGVRIRPCHHQLYVHVGCTSILEFTQADGTDRWSAYYLRLAERRLLARNCCSIFNLSVLSASA